MATEGGNAIGFQDLWESVWWMHTNNLSVISEKSLYACTWCKSRQKITKRNGKRKISEISSHNHLDAIESWCKKEKQHRHLQHSNYRSFKALPLKIPKSLTTTADENNISPKVVNCTESFVVINCNSETVDERMNNDMVVHELSKPFYDCLIKSVSTPGSDNIFLDRYCIFCLHLKHLESVFLFEKICIKRIFWCIYSCDNFIFIPAKLNKKTKNES